jgi:hypothetical protein
MLYNPLARSATSVYRYMDRQVKHWLPILRERGASGGLGHRGTRAAENLLEDVREQVQTAATSLARFGCERNARRGMPRNEPDHRSKP